MGLFSLIRLNGIHLFAKFICGVIINKLFAVYLGPSGLALFGQFQSFSTAIITLSGGAIGTGVTKFTAHHFDDEEAQKDIWRTGGTLVIFISLLTTLLLIALSKFIVTGISGSADYISIFIYLSLSCLFGSINVYILSILNGKKEYLKLVTANVIIVLAVTLITIQLTPSYGLEGALISIAVGNITSAVISVMIARRTTWMSVQNLFGGKDKAIAIDLIKVAIVIALPLFFTTFAQIFIRTFIADQYSWREVGYWEAIMRISGLYLMVITATMPVYLLPRLTEIRNKKELINELNNTLLLVTALVSFLGLFIYYFRNFLIVNFLDESFIPIQSLLKWQLIGDFFKIISFVFSYLMIAKGLYIKSILVEIFFSFTWCISVYILVQNVGQNGAQIGYMLSYALCVILQIIIILMWIKNYPQIKGDELK